MTTSSYSETTSPLLALSTDLANAVERAGQSVVAVNARRRFPSSGVHWRQGVIVTADHTLKRDEEITVTLPDGHSQAATLAGRDASTDLAVLRLPEASLPVAELGETAALKVGHLVLALGRSSEGNLSASWGVLSALSGSWRTWSGGQVDQFVRPDLTLYPGFSGGPLADAQGRIVGINSSGLSRRVGLSLPITTVNRVVEQLLTSGRIKRGYLGLGMQPVRLPDVLRTALNLPGSGGVIVVSIEPNGPGEQAGVLIGDVLVALADTAVSDPGEVVSLLGPERVGQPLKVSLVRGGNSAEVTITVGERPQRGE